MTLIEVLAALAILAVLLAGVLSARSDAERQLVRAERRLQAVQAADVLLSAWLAPSASSEGGVGVPCGESGTLGDDSQLGWQTKVQEISEAKPLSCQVVRFSVTDLSSPDEPVLLTVDLLVPLDERTDDHGDPMMDEEARSMGVVSQRRIQGGDRS